jgi:hypothetical protein
MTETADETVAESRKQLAFNSQYLKVCEDGAFVPIIVLVAWVKMRCPLAYLSAYLLEEKEKKSEE